MTPIEKFHHALTHLPLVAILRGVAPDEAGPMGAAIADAGFTTIEVPLNSPEPLASIALLREQFAADARMLIGAGTVLSAAQVVECAAAGAELIVSPHFDPAVVDAATRAGLVCLPGIMTPTEAFGALAAGAAGLKLFPAELAAPAVVKALLAVLPRGTPLLPVGGIAAHHMADWRAAGAAGFGIGSALYRPGKQLTAVAQDAARFSAAWDGTTMV